MFFVFFLNFVLPREGGEIQVEKIRKLLLVTSYVTSYSYVM